MDNEKKITNIVKFSVNDVVGNSTVTRTQAAVFYDDGSVEMLPMEDAIELSKNEKIKMTQTTPDNLEKNFQQYFTATPSKKKKVTTKEKKTLFQKIKNGLNAVKKFILKPFTLFYENIVVRGCEYATLHILQRDKLKQLQEELESEEEQEEKKGFFSRFKKEKEGNKEKKGFFSRFKKEKENNKEKKGFFSKFKKKKEKSKKKKSAKKRKRISTTIKAAVAAIVITVAGALGISSCINKNNPQVDSKSKVESTSNDLDNLTKNEIIDLIKEYKLTSDQVASLIEAGKISNDDFNGLSYEQLSYITTDDTQQYGMQKISSFMDKYNIDFADKCLDASAMDIRTALTWDEVNALNLAYNDYSQDQVKAMFNDAESMDFANAYKEGYLQLLGAYVLATDKNPVQLSQLIDSAEGKEFVDKYENSYYEAKNLTGDAKINSANIFLQKVIDDFSVNAKEKKDVESYKLAVAPIVGAAVSIFQDLEVNQANLEEVTTYFNNLGLYDQAEKNLNMSKALTGGESEENPTYQQFKNEKTKEQQMANVYYINDRSRDLSQLSSFQSVVEWHFKFDNNGNLKVGNTLDESIVQPEPEAKAEPVEQKTVVAQAKPAENVLTGTPTPQVSSGGNADVNNSTSNDYAVYGSPYNNDTSSDYATNNEQPIDTEEESVNTEGVDVNYNPAEELNNFQVDEVGDQTIISYDEESEEQNTLEQSQATTDETSSTSDTNSEVTTEETTEEAMPEDYTVTQMPDSNIFIVEYEEPVSETPEMTNEEKAEAMVQDMAENPENYTDQATNSETTEFVYQR